MNHKIGCDPEFAWHIESHNYTKYRGILPARMVLEQLQVVSPEMVNHSIKGAPAIKTEHGAIFPDGISWEINPNPGTPKEVLDNIEGLFTTTQHVKKLCSTKDAKLSFHIAPSMHLDTSMLHVWGDPTLTEFGCDPDESIWPREVNPSDIDAATHSYRYFGAHIHFGFPTENPRVFYRDADNIKRMILLADGYLGLLGLLFDQRCARAAGRRREVYGQPGVFRPQPHGIEYRTLSNSWLASPRRASLMLRTAYMLPNLFDSDVPEKIAEHGDRLRRALITASSGLVCELYSQFRHYPEAQDVLRFLPAATSVLYNYSVSGYTTQYLRKSWRIV